MRTTTTEILPKRPSDSVHFGNTRVEPSLWLHPMREPHPVKVVSVTSLGKSKNPETAYAVKVVLDLSGSRFVQDGKLQLRPGQHLGLVFPGSGHPRWYSIASTGRGEGRPNQVALIVRRLEYTQGDQLYQGQVSNKLARMKPGDEVLAVGPPINRFLLPEDRSGNLLLFSVGVAIAPYRGGLKARFEEQTGPVGETRLYTGYRTKDDELVTDELNRYAADESNRFHYRSAFSREPGSQARYLADLIERDADNVLRMLKDGKTRVYICGIIGMERGIVDAIVKAADARGEDGMALITHLKQEKRWIVEGARRN